MARKSKLLLDLEKYSEIAEGMFLNPKFKMSCSSDVDTNLRRFYNNIQNHLRSSHSIQDYKPSYATRYNAIESATIQSSNRVLSKLAESERSNQGFRDKPKEKLSEFF